MQVQCTTTSRGWSNIKGGEVVEFIFLFIFVLSWLKLPLCVQDITTSVISSSKRNMFTQLSELFWWNFSHIQFIVHFLHSFHIAKNTHFRWILKKIFFFPLACLLDLLLGHSDMWVLCFLPYCFLGESP